MQALAALLLAVPLLLGVGSDGGVRAQSRQAVGVDDQRVVDRPLKLKPHPIVLSGGKRFTLNLPEGYDITVAIDGLKRVRFMAKAPDGRYFATDMYDRTDNTKGTVYLLDGFDPTRGRFSRAVPYLTRLRNPNSIAFHTDSAGAHWLYLALTDCLLRYRFTPGDTVPGAAPDTLARFPAYGLSYKYGGWHLTRTVVVGGDGRLYVAVGSSCNACEEKEGVRASMLRMDLDGRNQEIIARGLRNAVGVRWASDALWATNMGADHLGDDRPDDAVYAITPGVNYGWPSCYLYRGRVYADSLFRASPSRVDPRTVPVPYASFRAHSAPLGLEYFGGFPDAALDNFFLVALHGSGNVPLKRGYTVARVKHGAVVRDFITGFLRDGKIYGRPCDILRVDASSFFVTDDHAGAVYYVRHVGAR